jgi:hypothetical protein
MGARIKSSPIRIIADRRSPVGDSESTQARSHAAGGRLGGRQRLVNDACASLDFHGREYQPAKSLTVIAGGALGGGTS